MNEFDGLTDKQLLALYETAVEDYETRQNELQEAQLGLSGLKSYNVREIRAMRDQASRMMIAAYNELFARGQVGKRRE